MTRPLSLRHRTTIAFTLMGLVLSTIFALGTAWMADDYESTLVQEILQSQAEDYSARLMLDPRTSLPRTRRLSGYLHRSDGRSDVPIIYRSLKPGFYEASDEDDSGAHIGVFDTRIGRMYFVIDLGAIERFERHLDWAIVVVLVVGTALSGWLGWLLAGGALWPVRVLAKAVDGLPTQPQATRLAESISEDDLGRVAGAIDRYQARLMAADDRERAFYADASHELRTPMSVVWGATEVLIDEPTADSGMRRRLQRLDRGMRELTDLLDILLGVARRREPRIEAVDARTLIEEAIEPLGLGRDDSPLRLELQATGSLRVPRHESLLLMRTAIRRVVPPGIAGTLRIALHGVTLDFDYAPARDDGHVPGGDGGARSDSGQPPRLAGRLAEQLGWRTGALDERADGGARLSLHLPDSALA